MVSWIPLMLMLIGRGGGNELLDYMSTAGYWKAKGVAVTLENMTAELGPQTQVPDRADDIATLVKDLGADAYDARESAQKKLVAMGPVALPQVQAAAKSDDPEVAQRAREVLRQIRPSQKGGAMAKAVRRLMAIRALGELKDPKALPVLRPLLGAAEPFVADFARRAVARIEGQAPPRTDQGRDAGKDDVWLLPAGCALAAHMSFPRGEQVSIDTVLDNAGPLLAGDNRERALAMLTQAVLSVAERVGNVRLDAITVGVSGRFAPAGFIVAIVRGQYDPVALKTAMRQLSPRVRTREVGGIEVFSADGEDVAFLIVSDRCLAVVTGPGHNLPIEPVARALRARQGGLATNDKLARLIKRLDRKGGLWAAATLTDAYRQVEFFSPFDTATLVGRRQADALNLTLVARGQDPARVEATVDKFNAAVVKAADGLNKAGMPEPFGKPIGEFLRSVKARAAGGEARATATLKGSPAGTMLMAFFGLQFRVVHGAHAQRAQARGVPRGRCAPVTAEVTVNGKPLAKGSMLLIPDRAKGNRGRASHGTIKGGKLKMLTTYEAGDGALVGWHRVEIHSMIGDTPDTARDVIPAKYNRATTLGVEVKAGKKNHFKFQLRIP